MRFRPAQNEATIINNYSTSALCITNEPRYLIIAFVKNYQEMLLDLADFALQEQPEDNLMVAISRECYNGSYTMAIKPIKSLE